MPALPSILLPSLFLAPIRTISSPLSLSFVPPPGISLSFEKRCLASSRVCCLRDDRLIYVFSCTSRLDLSSLLSESVGVPQCPMKSNPSSIKLEGLFWLGSEGGVSEMNNPLKLTPALQPGSLVSRFPFNFFVLFF